MKIAIMHLGNLSQLIPATSVIKGINKQNIDTDITWIVNEKEFCDIFKYNKKVNKSITFEQFAKEKAVYDLFIHLYPYFPENICTNSTAEKSVGFLTSSHLDQFKEVLMGKGKFLNINILQLYFSVCGLTWKGEGYDIPYYPKSKTNNNRIGVSVANANIRKYVLKNLKIDNKKIWYVPHKKNVLKRMNEINKCKIIITDDLTTFHLSMAMRKYVYFLETFPLLTKLELFNNGEIHKVPMNRF
jgi:hypothetical protein